MPAACEEFTATELAAALGEGRARAEELLGCAWELDTRLPGTAAALRDGTISRYKADIILRATQFLDSAEAAAAEGKVLGRAGRLTPSGLRAAIARAVLEVAPGKARTRREGAARVPVDDPIGAAVHHRADAVPHLVCRAGDLAGWSPDTACGPSASGADSMLEG